MQEEQLLMTQADRDRLVALKKVQKKVITQREAAEELELSIRQVQRLLYGLQDQGDKAVIHGLLGRPSNRRIEERIERQAVKILSAPVYEGFGRHWRRSTCARNMGSRRARRRCGSG